MYDENIENTILNKIEDWPFHKIANLSKKINRKREEIFPTRRKRPKYGELKKYLSKEKYEKILNHEKKEKIKLAYDLMYYMGLRISEVVEVKKTDIIEDMLIIRNIKCNRNDTLKIPSSLKEKLNNFILMNKNKIKENQDFIFFSENFNKTRYNISKDWLRNHWRKLCECADIVFIYDESKESMKKDRRGILRTPRKLNLISSHALRHSFGQRFYEKCKDPKLTQIVMRHTDIATTMEIYCRGNREKAFNIMNEI